MGGGSTTPTDSPVNQSGSSGDADDGFSERMLKGVSQSQGTSINSNIASSSGSISGEWKESDNPQESFAQFAASDPGHDSELSSFVKSQPTQRLEKEFNQAKDSGESLSSADRFIGGVLVSRPDSNVSADEITDFESNVDMSLGDRELGRQRVQQHMEETLAVMDEYVAGQVMSQIGTVEFTTLDKYAGKYVSIENKIRLDANDMTRRGRNGVVSHEMGHALEAKFGTTGMNDNPWRSGSAKDYTYERGKTMSSTIQGKYDTTESTAFDENLEEISYKLADSAAGGNNPGMSEPITSYQLKNSSEVIAVGFGEYVSDFVNLSNKQPDMVDHIDTHVIGGGWQEVSSDELQASGGPNSDIISTSNDLPVAHAPSDAGGVVRVKTSQISGDGELKTGVLVEAGDDGSIKIARDGRIEEFGKRQYTSLEKRTWG